MESASLGRFTVRFAFPSPYTVGMQSGNNHRVLMQFQCRNGWHVSFLEPDCRTVLPLRLTFATPDKIRTMQERFGSQLTEDRQALEHGLEICRGSAWLTLEEEQYRKLYRVNFVKS